LNGLFALRASHFRIRDRIFYNLLGHFNLCSLSLCFGFVSNVVLGFASTVGLGSGSYAMILDHLTLQNYTLIPFQYIERRKDLQPPWSTVRLPLQNARKHRLSVFNLPIATLIGHPERF
jgi:hypothetical protein